MILFNTHLHDSCLRPPMPESKRYFEEETKEGLQNMNLAIWGRENKDRTKKNNERELFRCCCCGRQGCLTVNIITSQCC